LRQTGKVQLAALALHLKISLRPSLTPWSANWRNGTADQNGGEVDPRAPPTTGAFLVKNFAALVALYPLQVYAFSFINDS